MQYGGIIGKNQEISRYELNVAGAVITHQAGLMIFFQHKNPDTHRAGLTKRGRVVSLDEVKEAILEKEPKIIGSNDKDFAMKNKREHHFIKRAKVIETHKTDYDVKTKGLEIILLPNEEYLLIENYQNIPLYEAIDMEKPASGMVIGMMPSKLAHLLLSIATHTSDKKEPTVRDPFAGFGTTNMIANAMGLDTIASDKNITQAKRNMGRREKHSLATDKRVTLRKHDVTQEFGPVFSHADIVVSEGRLGPIASGKTQPNSLRHHVKKIVPLYQDFFKNIQKMKDKGPSIVVITIPEYDRFTYDQPRDILALDNIPGLITLAEVYRRKDQRVGRRILVRKRP